jgi:hypothetical protein
MRAVSATALTQLPRNVANLVGEQLGLETLLNKRDAQAQKVSTAIARETLCSDCLRELVHMFSLIATGA